MPAIVAKSISILSDAGLGMAMFSLGKLISKIPFQYDFLNLQWRSCCSSLQCGY